MPGSVSGLHRWVDRCRQIDRSAFLPFVVEETPVGWIPKAHLRRFWEHPRTFEVSETAVRLNPEWTLPQERTEAVAQVLGEWRERGWVPGWREELYRVSPAFDQPPLLLMERAAAPLFGVCSYGVHLNGFVRRAEGLWLWLARRAQDRPQYPGFLDHLVAGGLTAGQTAREVALRECHEEAGIPESLARRCRPTGFVSLFMEHQGLVKRDLLFTYDLELPEDFQPHNTDGEVEAFLRVPGEEALRIVAETDEVKLNCNLVMIDFFLRHGLIHPDQSGYVELLKGIRHPDCA